MKQVIVIRKDLNMRKGKMVAQGCHASINALLNLKLSFTKQYWLENGQKKICVYVNSEQELKDLYIKADKVGLPCSLIQDAGLTEFKEPTFTAVGIGPAEDSEIDKITGDLKLL